MAFENDLKRIDHRDWDVLKEKWLSYIPSFNMPGESPEHDIFEFPGLDKLYLEANKVVEYNNEVPFLRQEILREAIFYLHKGVHVCGASNLHIENGVLSWSISSAYQSSYFLLKSILGFLGLSFPRINTALMIDCFPADEVLSSKQRKRGDLPQPYMKFIVLPKLSHKHMWQIFQRVLNVSTINVIDSEVKKFLVGLNVEQFAEQRNSLHYKNNYWLFPEDLYKRIFDSNFGADRTILNENLFEDLELKNDFTIYLNYIFIRIAINLIKDIGHNAKSVEDEYDLILNTLREGIHSRLVSSVAI